LVINVQAARHSLQAVGSGTLTTNH
jgi:hypothetical protein